MATERTGRARLVRQTRAERERERIYTVHVRDRVQGHENFVRAKSNRGEERLKFKFCRDEKKTVRYWLRGHCMPEMINGAVRTCRYPACAACA
jgi:hypothetical protein